MSGSRKEYMKQYYQAHVEKAREYSSNYRKAHAEELKAWRKSHAKELYELNRQWRLKNPELAKQRDKEYHLKSKEKRKIRDARKTRMLKETVIQHYGSKCDCCGESRLEFLCIDHINGGGNEHRKKLKRYGSAFYDWLIKNDFPMGFRVLCHNCNMSIALYGYCPHKS